MDIQISIIMLTYNRAQYLPLAIKSVLAQSFLDWELLVIDGGSTDATEDLIKDYQLKDPRIIYIKKDKNFGISRCRNLGLSLALGKYIAVLDSDDIWIDNDKLKKQVNYLEANPNCVLVGGGVVVINEQGKETHRYLHHADDRQIRNRILSRNQFAHSAVLYRKDIAQAAGGYATNIKIGEEYDLWLRMGRLGEFHNLHEYLIQYRIHSGGACVADRLGGAFDTLKIIKHFHKNYPNYFFAVTKAYFRILYYLWLKFTDRFRFSK